MPTLPIYFNLPCGSFTLLTHRTCLPSFLLFSPQFYISFLHGFVLPNIIYFLATSLHSSLPFHAIPNYIYISPANALSLPRAPHFSTSLITLSATFIPSPSLTHTTAPVSSLSPSTTTSQSHIPTALGSQYPLYIMQCNATLSPFPEVNLRVFLDVCQNNSRTFFLVALGWLQWSIAFFVVSW